MTILGEMADTLAVIFSKLGISVNSGLLWTLS